MLKKTITFKDFNDVERTTDLYFNLTKTELVDWSADSPDGMWLAFSHGDVGGAGVTIGGRDLFVVWVLEQVGDVF